MGHPIISQLLRECRDVMDKDRIEEFNVFTITSDFITPRIITAIF